MDRPSPEIQSMSLESRTPHLLHAVGQVPHSYHTPLAQWRSHQSRPDKWLSLGHETHRGRNPRAKSQMELERPTIADVAVFPYVALAGDGKISLVQRGANK